jgi:hypothetical protein
MNTTQYIELVASSRRVDIPASMNELVFEVTQEEDGGFCAECLSENIFTQGDNWNALRRNVQEAVRAFYFDRPPAPKRIRLRLVRDELLAGA